MKKVVLSSLVVAALILSAALLSCEEKNDEFTVTFNSNGGSDVATQTIKEGKKVTKPEDPTRSGYTFDAWYKEAELTTKWDFDIDVVKFNVTLYANWISDDSDDVYLVTEISKIFDDSEETYVFEYDAKNRISKIFGCREWYDGYSYTWTETLNYNSAGDLISLKYEEPYYTDDQTTTYTRNGNIITIKESWWDENDGCERSETLELDAQGLLLKVVYEYFFEGGDWEKEVSTCQYQGKNLIKITYEGEEYWNGETESYSGITTLTYDDENAPFYHCKTPEWFLIYKFAGEYGFQNNIRTIDRNWWDHKRIVNAEYTYNDVGFPLTIIRKENVEEDEEENEYEYLVSFKYSNNSDTKNILHETPSLSNSGSVPIKSGVCTKNRQPFNHMFGNKVEYNRKK